MALFVDNLCPPALWPEFKRKWHSWCSQVSQTEVSAVQKRLTAKENLQRCVARCFIGSDFFFQQCCRHPELLERLMQEPDLGLSPLPEAILDSEQQLDRELRQLRNRVITEVIYRDFAQQWDIPFSCLRLSKLAEHCIQVALNWHRAQLVARFGKPRDAAGQVQSLVVLGMGKLGAQELNLSSDIDLIFAYPAGGQTDGERSLDNQQFFHRLCQRLIKSLDAVTVDGFVFRVDMRLRPYGNSGPLVSHFAALEDYYQAQGREWERYAMIKARPVAGTATAAEELQALLRPFSYRRYIDFGVIDALRDMKLLIQRQVRSSGLKGNIKLGRGGIREVEFIAQAFQLIRGGREPKLQQRNLLKLLPLLEQDKHLPRGSASQLSAAYLLLRRVEHALQAKCDQQTHNLPDESESAYCAQLAFALGRPDWQTLQQQVASAREYIAREFDQVIAPPEIGAAICTSENWETLWAGCHHSEERPGYVQQLRAAGFEPQAALKALIHLRSDKIVKALPVTARQRLDQMMPLLLSTAAETENSTLALERVIPLVRSILRRSAYLVLINENPSVLAQLLRLCNASPWIAEQLARYPTLLDEMLDPRRLLAPISAASISDELQQEMLRIEEDDLEAQMEALRHFKQSQSLRIAAQEVSQVLPLMQVSDALSWLAEAILKKSLNLAWQQLTKKHGVPAGGNEQEMQFGIVAYGKLGGLELGYGSDLDLVFIHDSVPQQYTDGVKPIDNVRFYTRLAQRLIHILQTRTLGGPLYEVDTRLRPSGNSGLLVTSLAAFAKYQRESAWTWEHQALVRARMVAGSEPLSKAFAQVRLQSLCVFRDEQLLRAEVCKMRDKMRSHLDSSSTNEFDLKQGTGGIVDIEFLVQYLALAGAKAAPPIVKYTDNIRILECLGKAGLLPADQIRNLIDAYKVYRSEAHRLALQQQPGVVPADYFKTQRKIVEENWKALLD
ncbi:MAG: bifunctional [glutamate--ammonia ligase]-adenylyl-L-tyrosine phosphorylase/[glutamate--ammonia-ligase] adenylyltransferase [Gammaproteobacteria bacterium]|nr:bifunctional [glutamate--ammonia ligase]-adenylyl-L-tyrosine phosphorylase/[glutamate--ammonia-ligase] adenylyltransferase [Gammaproteobacteria bacterium]